MTAEEQLMNELTENGTDKQRELFLAFQNERNETMELLIKVITILTIQIKLKNKKS